MVMRANPLMRTCRRKNLAEIHHFRDAMRYVAPNLHVARLTAHAEYVHGARTRRVRARRRYPLARDDGLRNEGCATTRSVAIAWKCLTSQAECVQLS